MMMVCYLLGLLSYVRARVCVYLYIPLQSLAFYGVRKDYGLLQAIKRVKCQLTIYRKLRTNQQTGLKADSDSKVKGGAQPKQTLTCKVSL